ncbi:glucose-1-phosphate cytidylyltransferase [soil metagenome]
MKVVLLAGGHGTRISEESAVRPKPMVEIGAQPILWHIMKLYHSHGLSDFVICCGYKGHLIKQYFANYSLLTSDLTVDLADDKIEIHRRHTEPWRVTLVDTGADTMTGGRLRRVAEHVDDATFCLTYGDGVGDVDITRLIEFHRREGRLATLTAVQPPGRFGGLVLHQDQTKVEHFNEKLPGDGESAWINGGFFVLEPGVLDYLESDATVFEREPLERLAHDGEMSAYRHNGFWQPMDTLRDKRVLEELWDSGKAPWRNW